jgi:diguanylate cyclase (GGDEF)-like protein/PAS domain S-box-containing protein
MIDQPAAFDAFAPVPENHEGMAGQRQHFLARLILEHVAGVLYLMDAEANIRDVNGQACRVLGYERAELLGMKVFDIAPDFSPASWPEHWQHMLLSRERTLKSRHRTRQGRFFPVEIKLSLFEFEGRHYSLALVQDITDRQRHLEELRRREQEFRALAENSPDTISRYDRECRRIYANPALARLAGTTADTLLGKQPSDHTPTANAHAYEKAILDAVASGESQEFELTWPAHDGRMITSQVRLMPEFGPDSEVLSVLAIGRDITAIRESEQRLHEMTFHDILTGLPNRALFNDRLGKALSEAMRRAKVLGLLVLDLDRFKEINDTHGHGVGDRLLHESAQRLRNVVRDFDTVARLGGDEFAIVLPDVREAADLGGVSRKVLDTLARPFHIDGQELFISASIGIAVFPSDGSTTADLLQFADAALYHAKDRGRAGFRFYSAELTAKAKERATLETALRRAEPEGELELYYQPKVDLSNGALVGAEALLRWNHPTLGLVTPDRFIGIAEDSGLIVSIAEDSGLIVSIGAWVLTKACLAAQRWNQRSGQVLKVAVNLSPRQFCDNDLLMTVCSVLTITGCEPQWLELEITESLLLDDDDNIRTTLLAFRNLGISIAIDDFGTGYSALGYLKRFPIDTLKIDRSFTRDIAVDRDSTELVKAIITMAHSLRLGLVAEGIESEQQERFLRAHGCHLGQGYRYGRPMPLAAFEALLALDGSATRLVGQEGTS